MPRQFHRLLLPKAREDLQRLVEDLYIKVVTEDKMGSLPPVQRDLLQNLISYRKKLDELNQEQINLLWESAAKLVSDIFDKDTDTVIDESKAEDRPEFLDGPYWIFPKSGRYIKCEQDHFRKASEKISDFGEELGLDAWDLQKALHSGDKALLPLLLKAGAILAWFTQQGKIKTARYQLCNCSVPWLRQQMGKSPIWQHSVYVYDPRHKYGGDRTGIFFKFRRSPLKINRTPLEDR